MCIYFYTYIYIYTHTPAHTHTHTHTLSLLHTHTHKHTLTYALSFSHTHTRSLSLTHTHTLTHLYTRTLSLTNTHKHTHTSVEMQRALHSSITPSPSLFLTLTQIHILDPLTPSHTRNTPPMSVSNSCLQDSRIWCHCGIACKDLFWIMRLMRGGGLGSRPKKMYGQRLGDGVEYHLMSPTPRY